MAAILGSQVVIANTQSVRQIFTLNPPHTSTNDGNRMGFELEDSLS